MGIGLLVGLLVVGIPRIFRHADIRIAVHGQRVFPLRNGLYRGYRRGGVARRALGRTEVQLPPAFLGCGECVKFSGGHPVFGGIVLRTECADLSRGLVCSEYFDWTIDKRVSDLTVSDITVAFAYLPHGNRNQHQGHPIGFSA